METGNSNLPANVLQMATALAQSVSQAGASGSNDPYMKFTRQGEWVYGVENIEVEEGSIWAVNPLGFLHGWTAWGNKANNNEGQNVGEHMVPAQHPMPAESSLPAVKGDWSKCIGIQMRCTSGEDDGVQVLYKSNSHGGRKAFAAILQSVIEKLQAQDRKCMPLVHLLGTSYKHKKYGDIYNPVLEVIGWAALDDAAPAAEPAAAAIEAPAAAPQQQQEQAQEQPVRRRRRREG